MAKRRQLRGFDLKQIYGFGGLIGVDEAGRGALAGPVVAAAVLVSPEFLEGRWAVGKSGRVNDSKQLSAAERSELYAEFEELVAQGQIHANFGAATVAEIETVNILGATKLAMRRALEGIYPPDAFARKTEPDLFASEAEKAAFRPTISCQILIDGLPLRSFPYPHQGIVSICRRADVFARARRLRGRHRHPHLLEVPCGAQRLEDLRRVLVMAVGG